MNIAELESRCTHKHTKALLLVLIEQGWLMEITGQNQLSFRHPRSGDAFKTPEYIPASWWGDPTYWIVRKIRVNVGNEYKFLFMGTWFASAPWVTVSERILNFKSATAYILDESWIKE